MSGSRFIQESRPVILADLTAKHQANSADLDAFKKKQQVRLPTAPTTYLSASEIHPTFPTYTSYTPVQQYLVKQGQDAQAHLKDIFSSVNRHQQQQSA